LYLFYIGEFRDTVVLTGPHENPVPLHCLGMALF
jgi:hypothetical protein